MTEKLETTVKLSKREWQIANAYAQGASYKAVADELGIAPATVRTHLGTIYRKMAISSKVELLKAVQRISADTSKPTSNPPIESAELQSILRGNTTSAGPGSVFAIDDIPTIAVLPFDNVSPDPEQAYFADGLTEDIITRLSYLRGIRTVSRASSFAFRGQSGDATDVVRSLGARYLLTGSVRKFGPRIRVTAQVIDGNDGHPTWSQKYDRELTDIFDIQDDITFAIVKAMQVKLTDGEVFEGRASTILSLDAWEAYHRGIRAFQTYTPESMMNARRYFRQTSKLEPEFLDARVFLAWCYWQDAHSIYSPNPDEQLHLARQEVDRFKSLGRMTPSALHMEAAMLTIEKRYDEALAVANEAAQSGPCNVFGLTPSCLANVYAGNFQAGLELLLTTLRQMPSAPNDTIWWLGYVLTLLEDHENSISAAKEYARRAPSDQHAYTLLALAHARAGQNQEAADAVTKLLALYPKYDCTFFRHHEPFREQSIVDGMVALLSAAGLPGDKA